MKRNCKTCTLNTTNDTVETCKRMCYLRYSKQRNKRICDLEQKIQQLDKLKAENDKYSFFIEKLCEYAGLECDSEEQATRTLLDFASQMYKAKVINDRLKTENEKLKKKMEKIKVICRCTKDSIYYGDCPTCDMCEKLYTKGIKHQDIILQIIDEVE